VSAARIAAVSTALAAASALGALACVVAADPLGSLTTGPVTDGRRPAAHRRSFVVSFRARRLVGGGIGVLIGAMLPFPGVLLTPLLCAIGARIPVISEGRIRRRRRAAADAQVPQLLDLLAASSSAGLSGQLALRRSVEALGDPLAVEFARALDAVDLGARWRDELKNVAERLDLPDLRRTVAALSRTETLGASLAEATAELAASVRSARRAAVTERARTAPVKMLFPLVFLVLPAFLLLTVVPVLLTTVQSIR
jgi:tight adherence protein C